MDQNHLQNNYSQNPAPQNPAPQGGYQQPSYQQGGYQQPYQQRPVYQTAPPQPVSPDTYTGDPKFKPLSPWAYLGYLLLYSVVPFGWIAAIVHATNNENINRRNFARGYWCMVLVGVAVSVVLIILSLVLGASLFSALNSSGFNW